MASSTHCSAADSRAVVTFSVGNRPFVHYTYPLMEAYAARVGAAFHFVNSTQHRALRVGLKKLDNARFLKLPLLEYYLRRYMRVLYLDDDVLISPATPDLFDAVPCHVLGATIEHQKPVGWHTLHWRSACALYKVPKCDPKAWRIFNSGVMVLSRQRHAPILAAWRSEKLECRVLCDQLFLNAAIARAGLALLDLGGAFNYVGSELRRALLTSTNAANARAVTATTERRRADLRAACLLHLTRKVGPTPCGGWGAPSPSPPPSPSPSPITLTLTHHHHHHHHTHPSPSPSPPPYPYSRPRWTSVPWTKRSWWVPTTRSARSNVREPRRQGATAVAAAAAGAGASLGKASSVAVAACTGEWRRLTTMTRVTWRVRARRRTRYDPSSGLGLGLGVRVSVSVRVRGSGSGSGLWRRRRTRYDATLRLGFGLGLGTREIDGGPWSISA